METSATQTMYKTLSTSQLSENPNNRRVISRENFDLLCEKLEKKRQYKPLLVTPLTTEVEPPEYMVLAGNHRLKAYKRLGVKEVWVSVLEFKLGDDGLWFVVKDGVPEIEKFQTKDDAMLDWSLTDNEEFAENDWDAFVNDMHGYNLDWSKYIISNGPQKTIANSLKDFLMSNDPEVTEDEAPEVSQEPAKSELGKVYQLGRHRLMCGDALKIENVAMLMDGQKADMVFTDPPYLMSFEGNVHADGSKSHNAIHGAIANDSLDRAEGEKFIYNMFTSLRTFCTGAFYITFYRLGMDYIFRAMDAQKIPCKSVIIWNKGNHTLSNSDYMSMYEPIFYGWFSEHEFYGKPAFDIWDVQRTQINDLHPTMKPIALCAKAINNSSKNGGSVLDLFAGSGSTLMACEQTSRTGYMMELDPKYCDVIRKRYHKFTNANNEDGWEEATPKQQQQDQ